MPHAYETDGAAIYRQSFATIRAEADLARFDTDEETVAVERQRNGLVEIHRADGVDGEVRRVRLVPLGQGQRPGGDLLGLDEDIRRERCRHPELGADGRGHLLGVLRAGDLAGADRPDRLVGDGEGLARQFVGQRVARLAGDDRLGLAGLALGQGLAQADHRLEPGQHGEPPCRTD